MIPHADRLISRARTGEKLTTKERRYCVAFMMAMEPDATNAAMGDLFQVSERTIRDDKVCVRQEKAKEIREDDLGNVIADVALSFERQIRDIEASKRSKECKPGTRTYLEHCRSIFAMELQKVEALQALGFYPKNLGQMTVTKFDYVATVGVMTEGSAPKAITEGRASDEVIDAEFSDTAETKLLPAPLDTITP